MNATKFDDGLRYQPLFVIRSCLLKSLLDRLMVSFRHYVKRDHIKRVTR